MVHARGQNERTRIDIAGRSGCDNIPTIHADVPKYVPGVEHSWLRYSHSHESGVREYKVQPGAKCFDDFDADKYIWPSELGTGGLRMDL